MTALSVNINKVATIRNARGGNNPDIIQVAMDCESFGAQGVTVHPRPDERHIRYKDVYDLKKVVTTELNVEGYPSTQFMDLVLDIVPDQVTLVPDPPNALTSNTGWDTTKHLVFLSGTIAKLQDAGIRTSIFLNPDPSLILSAKETGTDRIELYTGDYANGFNQDKKRAIIKFKETAYEATKYDIGINAGHDLDLNNLKYFAQEIPDLLEVSIGHALICDALYLGLEETIKRYLTALRV